MSEKLCAHCQKPIPFLGAWRYRVAKYCGRACSTDAHRTDPATRFLALCSPGPNGCTEWSGNKTRFGYGMFNDGTKNRLAHRVVWEKTRGVIPGGLCVLHRCDNPSCVNPEHLFLGTKADNNRDKIAKGRARHPAGSKANNAKLVEDQVRAILADERQYAEIAAAYGVSHATISHIKNGRNWKAICAEFARRSTDEAMREAMKEQAPCT